MAARFYGDRVAAPSGNMFSTNRLGERVVAAKGEAFNLGLPDPAKQGGGEDVVQGSLPARV